MDIIMAYNQEIETGLEVTGKISEICFTAIICKNSDAGLGVDSRQILQYH